MRALDETSRTVLTWSESGPGRVIEALAVSLLTLLSASPATASCLGCSCEAQAVALNFGNYDPIGSAATDGSAYVRVRCGLLNTGLLPVLVSYDIGISAGGAGDYTNRRLSGPGGLLSYNIYRDSSRTSLWGPIGSGAELTVSYGTDLLSTWVRSDVYGRLPARQTVGAGSYSDTLLVTVSY